MKTYEYRNRIQPWEQVYLTLPEYLIAPGYFDLQYPDTMLRLAFVKEKDEGDDALLL